MKQDGCVFCDAGGRDQIAIGPDECYVKVLIAGVCNTDVEIMKGYMGRGRRGHEFVGCARARRTTTSTGRQAWWARSTWRVHVCCNEEPSARNHCRSGPSALTKRRIKALTLPARNLHVCPTQ